MTDTARLLNRHEVIQGRYTVPNEYREEADRRDPILADMRFLLDRLDRLEKVAVAMARLVVNGNDIDADLYRTDSVYKGIVHRIHRGRPALAELDTEARKEGEGA